MVPKSGVLGVFFLRNVPRGLASGLVSDLGHFDRLPHCKRSQFHTHSLPQPNHIHFRRGRPAQSLATQVGRQQASTLESETTQPKEDALAPRSNPLGGVLARDPIFQLPLLAECVRFPTARTPAFRSRSSQLLHCFVRYSKEPAFNNRCVVSNRAPYRLGPLRLACG